MPNQYIDFSSTNSTQRTCLSGHIISNHAEQEQSQQLWCHHCGAATIDKCPGCGGLLRGEDIYRAPLLPKPDAYCLHCGKALPWTETHIQAVREVAKYIETFDDADQKVLEEILPDLVCKKSTPKTEIGIVKMKALLRKGGVIFLEASRDILVGVISDAVKKSLYP